MSTESRKTAFKLALGALVVSAAALGYGVWAAVIDTVGSNRLIVPLRVERPGEAQLFYDRGAGIREEDSARVEVLPSAELEDVAFPVPRVPLREVRFDPFIGAGRFAIGQPRLESASGRFIAKFPLAAVVPRFQIVEFIRDGKQWVGETVPGANDPQLTFGLGAPLRVGKPRVPWIEGLVTAAVAVVALRLKSRAVGTVS